MPGRKAQPINILKAKGKKHLTKKEIKEREEAEAAIAFKVDEIKPPAWLSSFAKKEFRRLAKGLLEVKQITNADVNQLALYCDVYSIYIIYSKAINKSLRISKQSKTPPMPHPLLDKKAQLFAQMLKVAVEFGFTPCSKAKIAMPKKEKPEPSEFDKKYGSRV